MKTFRLLSVSDGARREKPSTGKGASSQQPLPSTTITVPAAMGAAGVGGGSSSAQQLLSSASVLDGIVDLFRDDEVTLGDEGRAPPASFPARHRAWVDRSLQSVALGYPLMHTAMDADVGDRTQSSDDEDDGENQSPDVARPLIKATNAFVDRLYALQLEEAAYSSPRTNGSNTKRSSALFDNRMASLSLVLDAIIIEGGGGSMKTNTARGAGGGIDLVTSASARPFLAACGLVTSPSARSFSNGSDLGSNGLCAVVKDTNNIDAIALFIESLLLSTASTAAIGGGGEGSRIPMLLPSSSVGADVSGSSSSSQQQGRSVLVSGIPLIITCRDEDEAVHGAMLMHRVITAVEQTLLMTTTTPSSSAHQSSSSSPPSGAPSALSLLYRGLSLLFVIGGQTVVPMRNGGNGAAASSSSSSRSAALLASILRTGHPPPPTTMASSANSAAPSFASADAASPSPNRRRGEGSGGGVGYSSPIRSRDAPSIVISDDPRRALRVGNSNASGVSVSFIGEVDGERSLMTSASPPRQQDDGQRQGLNSSRHPTPSAASAVNATNASTASTTPSHSAALIIAAQGPLVKDMSVVPVAAAEDVPRLSMAPSVLLTSSSRARGKASASPPCCYYPITPAFLDIAQFVQLVTTSVQLLRVEGVSSSLLPASWRGALGGGGADSGGATGSTSSRRAMLAASLLVVKRQATVARQYTGVMVAGHGNVMRAERARSAALGALGGAPDDNDDEDDSDDDDHDYSSAAIVRPSRDSRDGFVDSAFASLINSAHSHTGGADDFASSPLASTALLNLLQDEERSAKSIAQRNSLCDYGLTVFIAMSCCGNNTNDPLLLTSMGRASSSSTANPSMMSAVQTLIRTGAMSGSPLSPYRSPSSTSVSMPIAFLMRFAESIGGTSAALQLIASLVMHPLMREAVKIGGHSAGGEGDGDDASDASASSLLLTRGGLLNVRIAGRQLAKVRRLVKGYIDPLEAQLGGGALGGADAAMAADKENISILQNLSGMGSAAASNSRSAAAASSNVEPLAFAHSYYNDVVEKLLFLPKAKGVPPLANTSSASTAIFRASAHATALPNSPYKTIHSDTGMVFVSGANSSTTNANETAMSTSAMALLGGGTNSGGGASASTPSSVAAHAADHYARREVLLDTTLHWFLPNLSTLLAQREAAHQGQLDAQAAVHSGLVAALAAQNAALDACEGIAHDFAQLASQRRATELRALDALKTVLHTRLRAEMEAKLVDLEKRYATRRNYLLGEDFVDNNTPASGALLGVGPDSALNRWRSPTAAMRSSSSSVGGNDASVFAAGNGMASGSSLLNPELSPGRQGLLFSASSSSPNSGLLRKKMRQQENKRALLGSEASLSAVDKQKSLFASAMGDDDDGDDDDLLIEGTVNEDRIIHQSSITSDVTMKMLKEFSQCCDRWLTDLLMPALTQLSDVLRAEEEKDRAGMAAVSSVAGGSSSSVFHGMGSMYAGSPSHQPFPSASPMGGDGAAAANNNTLGSLVKRLTATLAAARDGAADATVSTASVSHRNNGVGATSSSSVTAWGVGGSIVTPPMSALSPTTSPRKLYFADDVNTTNNHHASNTSTIRSPVAHHHNTRGQSNGILKSASVNVASSNQQHNHAPFGSIASPSLSNLLFASSNISASQHSLAASPRGKFSGTANNNRSGTVPPSPSMRGGVSATSTSNGGALGAIRRSQQQIDMLAWLNDTSDAIVAGQRRGGEVEDGSSSNQRRKWDDVAWLRQQLLGARQMMKGAERALMGCPTTTMTTTSNHDVNAANSKRAAAVSIHEALSGVAGGANSNNGAALIGSPMKSPLNASFGGGGGGGGFNAPPSLRLDASSLSLAGADGDNASPTLTAQSFVALSGGPDKVAASAARQQHHNNSYATALIQRLVRELEMAKHRAKEDEAVVRRLRDHAKGKEDELAAVVAVMRNNAMAVAGLGRTGGQGGATSSADGRMVVFGDGNGSGQPQQHGAAFFLSPQESLSLDHANHMLARERSARALLDKAHESLGADYERLRAKEASSSHRAATAERQLADYQRRTDDELARLRHLNERLQEDNVRLHLQKAQTVDALGQAHHREQCLAHEREAALATAHNTSATSQQLEAFYREGKRIRGVTTTYSDPYPVVGGHTSTAMSGGSSLNLSASVGGADYSAGTAAGAGSFHHQQQHPQQRVPIPLGGGRGAVAGTTSPQRSYAMGNINHSVLPVHSISAGSTSFLHHQQHNVSTASSGASYRSSPANRYQSPAALNRIGEGPFGGAARSAGAPVPLSPPGFRSFASKQAALCAMIDRDVEEVLEASRYKGSGNGNGMLASDPTLHVARVLMHRSRPPSPVEQQYLQQQSAPIPLVTNTHRSVSRPSADPAPSANASNLVNHSIATSTASSKRVWDLLPREQLSPRSRRRSEQAWRDEPDHGSDTDAGHGGDRSTMATNRSISPRASQHVVNKNLFGSSSVPSNTHQYEQRQPRPSPSSYTTAVNTSNANSTRPFATTHTAVMGVPPSSSSAQHSLNVSSIREQPLRPPLSSHRSASSTAAAGAPLGSSSAFAPATNGSSHVAAGERPPMPFASNASEGARSSSTTAAAVDSTATGGGSTAHYQRDDSANADSNQQRTSRRTMTTTTTVESTRSRQQE